MMRLRQAFVSEHALGLTLCLPLGDMVGGEKGRSEQEHDSMAVFEACWIRVNERDGNNLMIF